VTLADRQPPLPSSDRPSSAHPSSAVLSTAGPSDRPSTGHRVRWSSSRNRPWTRALAHAWTRLSPPGRVLAAVGIAMFASAAFHTVVFLLSGTPWDGAVSWRKPVTFGLSLGLTAVTVALIETRLRLARWASWVLLGGLAAVTVFEDALITLQAWRGVPSHFNIYTEFDAAVFSTMGKAVAVLALILTVLTVLSFTSARRGAPAITLAVRAGLVLLLVGQVLGAAIVAAGTPDMMAGNREAVFGPQGVLAGAAGILKSPHGIALHAVQVLPLLGWLASRAPWTDARRLLAVWAATAGYSLVLGASVVQAYSGRAPWDPGLPLLLAAVGAVLLAAAYARVLAGLAGPVGLVGRGRGRNAATSR
jgi:hypothetical protein